MGVLDGDSSFVAVGTSSMMMGSFEGGWGFPIFNLVLFWALKYIDGCLFLFPLGLGGVLSVARIVVASLSSVLGDTSSFFASSSSFAVFPVSTVFYFVCSSACLVSTFLVATFFWTLLGFFLSVLGLFFFYIVGLPFFSFDSFFFSTLGSSLVVSCFSSPIWFSSFLCGVPLLPIECSFLLHGFPSQLPLFVPPLYFHMD